MAGAATATVLVGKMVVPVIDTDKTVDEIMKRLERAQRMIERKVFGSEIDRRPTVAVGYRPRNSNEG